ncbi:MAG: Kelch repeat-containing protein [Terriglobales bacterium]
MKSKLRIDSGWVRASLSAVLLLFIIFIFPHNLRSAAEPKVPAMPVALSNSAFATSHPGETGQKIFLFMGIGSKKTWDAVTASAYELDLKTQKWIEKRPVPGVAGRLAASAVAVSGQVFLFGGYVLDDSGHETTLSDLNVYVPFEDRYYRGKDIPVPVDDAVVGLFRDRFIYVIGGRSKGEAVRNVQIYDTEKDEWTQATPLPGMPVFGHSGAIVGDTIIYVDGAYRNPDSKGPKYIASSECWMGKIPTSKKADITKIEWTKLPAHPGNARFRVAAGAGPAERKGGKIYFSGGTDNPYDYNGIGYDGKPSEPSPVTFAFDTKRESWETIDENTSGATMDNRGLAVANRELIMVGGMEKGQQVTSKVTIVNLKSKK